MKWLAVNAACYECFAGEEPLIDVVGVYDTPEAAKEAVTPKEATLNWKDRPEGGGWFAQAMQTEFAVIPIESGEKSG